MQEVPHSSKTTRYRFYVPKLYINNQTDLYIHKKRCNLDRKFTSCIAVNPHALQSTTRQVLSQSNKKCLKSLDFDPTSKKSSSYFKTASLQSSSGENLPFIFDNHVNLYEMCQMRIPRDFFKLAQLVNLNIHIKKHENISPSSFQLFASIIAKLYSLQKFKISVLKSQKYDRFNLHQFI